MLLGVKMCGNPMWEAIEVSYGCTLASVRVRKSMVKVVIGHMCVVIFVQIQCISGSNIAPQKLKTLCTSWHQHIFPNQLLCQVSDRATQSFSLCEGTLKHV